MTQVLNPNDTGEIHGGEGGNLELTARLPLADVTEKIYITQPPPLAYRRPTTLAYQVEAQTLDAYPVASRPQTLADTVMALDPVPAWTGRVGEFPPVEPRVVPDWAEVARAAAEVPVESGGDFLREAQHRRPAPRWTRWAINAGMLLIGLSGGTLALLAVIR